MKHLFAMSLAVLAIGAPPSLVGATAPEGRA